jgi:excisionase family DNA binding protein
MSNGRALLTLSEVAEQLRCSVMTVRRLIRTKQISAVRVRGRLLVRATAFEAYIERNTLHAVGE